MIEININDKAKVKLTELGKDIFYHQYDELNKFNGKEIIRPSFPKIDENGYTEFQLWTLMDLYGEHLTLTGTVENNTLPFETNILIYQGGR